MRKIMILSFSIVLVVALVALAFAFGEKEVPETDTSSSSQSKLIYSTSNSHSSQGNQEIDAMAEEEKKEIYYVREYQGHIGVFEGEEQIPVQELDVEVSSLPKTDQLLLAKGLTASTKQELARILEDYGS